MLKVAFFYLFPGLLAFGNRQTSAQGWLERVLETGTRRRPVRDPDISYSTVD